MTESEERPDWYDESKLRRVFYAGGGYTGWVIDLGDGTCRYANDPLLGKDGPRWGDRVRLVDTGETLPRALREPILERYQNG